MAIISKVKRVPGFLGRRIASILETVNGRTEKSRLERGVPELRYYNQLAFKTTEKLQPLYEKYITTISTGAMALSLEASVFMSVLCNIYQPKNILDLGSGFSSAVFRLYAETADPKPHICSIDDASEWLDKTEDFLFSNQLDVGQLMTWNSFINQNQDSFDFILHDLGSMKTREELLPKVLSLVSPNGIVFLDDIHKTNYRKSAKRIVKESGLIYHNLKSYTLDRFKRYCALATHE
jgi:predicted O-methyltransferase YrrM